MRLLFAHLNANIINTGNIVAIHAYYIYNLFMLNLYTLQRLKSLWRQWRSIIIMQYDNTSMGIKTALNILL